MFGLLSTIVNTIISLVSFVGNSINSLVQLLLMIPSYISYLVTAVGFLPNPLFTFALVTLSLFVVLFVLDR